MIVGVSLIFAPISVAAFLYTPTHLRGAAVGMLALLRNEGGSVGVSLGQAIQRRRDQFHVARLNEFLDPFNPAVDSFLGQSQGAFLQQTGDPVASHQMALETLDGLRQQQSLALADFDVFWVSAVVGGALVLLVALMKRSVAGKGAHIHME
jgi:DHA2 family multidrug resistance protein